ncbi:MAG: FG-GAP-like repeat-containing protein [Bacteroidia bacterium]
MNFKKASLFFLIAVCFRVSGQVAFSFTTNLPAGGSPRQIITGDFNLDSKADIAVVHDIGINNVSIFLGNGSGGFSAAMTASVGIAASSIMSADFNSDGKPDLATANGDSNSVSIALGNGTGAFGPSQSFSVTGSPYALTSADFNLDGKLDVATANYSPWTGGTTAVLLGDGTGGLGAPLFLPSGGGSIVLVSSDYNKDSYPDLAVGLDGPSQVVLFLGNGAGGFGSPHNFSVDWYPLAMVNGDFNEDGNMDLVTGNYYGNNVSVLLGHGNGAFMSAMNFPAVVNPYTLTTADFNGDTHLDLALTKGAGNDSLAILLGIGNGRFCPPIKFPIASSSESLINADFNLDGKQDLATDTYFNSGLLVMFNKSTPLLPLTISGDSVICVGESTTLTTINNSYNYYWTGPAPSMTKVGTGTSTVVDQDGVYTLHIKNYCFDTLNYAVHVDTVIASFTASETLSLAPSNETFLSTSHSAYGAVTNYYWNFGNGNAASTTNNSTVSYYDNKGEYSVSLVVTDNFGCKDTVTKKITVVEIVIPNVFTPNGDNINDIFSVSGADIGNIKCAIFDRWGIELYHWDGLYGGWNGKNKNGVACTDGTYYYQLTYSDNSHKTHAKNGFFLLER